jgi:hypothetical protein
MKLNIIHIYSLALLIFTTTASIQTVNNMARQTLTQQIANHVQFKLNDIFSKKQVTGYTSNPLTLNTEITHNPSIDYNQINYLGSSPLIHKQNIKYETPGFYYPSSTSHSVIKN